MGLNLKPDSVAVDVGANIGAFTVALAQLYVTIYQRSCAFLLSASTRVSRTSVFRSPLGISFDVSPVDF